ncbi:hypothetical protein T03_4759, partial [Trichinella britovi]
MKNNDEKQGWTKLNKYKTKNYEYFRSINPYFNQSAQWYLVVEEKIIIAIVKLQLILLNMLNSSHSRICLPENVCKFLFHCYAYVYGVLVSMIARLRCAVRMGWLLTFNAVWLGGIAFREYCFSTMQICFPLNNCDRRTWWTSTMRRRLPIQGNSKKIEDGDHTKQNGKQK